MNESEQRAPDPRRTTRQYSRLVGIAFLAFVVFMAVRIVDSNKQGGTGLSLGDRAPKFAAPSATGELTGDANIFQDRDQAERGGSSDALPACEVTEKDAIRVCDYFDKPLVMVVWFTKCGSCEQQLDVLERVSHDYPKVNFLGLDVKDSVENSGKIVKRNGWTFPMAVDEDGQVASLYNVGVGPTTFFIYPGGVVQHTAIGELDQRTMREDVDRLVRLTRERIPGARPADERS